MTKNNTPTQDKHEDIANMHWLRVLEFGTEVIHAKANEQTRPAYISAVVVLP